MSSIHADILQLISDKAEALGLPAGVSIGMDFLALEGDAVSYQPNQAPKTSKAWIDGTKTYALSFSILAVTDGSQTSAPNIEAVNWLESIAALFEGMNNFSLSDERTVISGVIQTPAIIRRTEDNRLVYSIDIEIEYKE